MSVVTQRSDELAIGATSYLVVRAKADVAAATTAGVLVAAVAGFRIRVLWVATRSGATATTIVFNSASTAISCVEANASNGGSIRPLNNFGWFQTNVGEALTVTTGAGSTTGVEIGYILIP